MTLELSVDRVADGAAANLASEWTQSVHSTFRRDEARHFLIATAPFGPFAATVAHALRNGGAACTRVVLNGGDLCDWGIRHAAHYFGAAAGFEDWLESAASDRGVTDMVIFGDSNLYSACAKRVAKRMGLRIHVLEEGYFRPHWITLERDGVNGHSSLPREPSAYRDVAAAAPAPAHTPVQKHLAAGVWRIVAYHVALYAMAWMFFRYRAPYAYSPIHQAFGHVLRSLGKPFRSRRGHRRLGIALKTTAPVFLVLLQRPGDSQLLRHSPIRTVSALIEHVLVSFAEHAPPNARIVFRSHPLDHGLERQKRTLGDCTDALGLSGRTYLIDQGNLEELLDRVTGVVTVNSTGGLAALGRGRPTIALGNAIYNLEGLTHQGGLDRFWTEAEAPDSALLGSFRNVVMGMTQVNGAFATRAGIRLAAPEVCRRLLSA